jgi:hypothetical protein
VARAAVERRHADKRSLSPLENFAVGWLVPSDRCKTAYWKIDEKTGEHAIRINPIAYDTITRQADPAAPLRGKRKSHPLFYTRVFDHERAHSLYTTRELKKLADRLKAAEIPWLLCNLFEDVRIEHKWVKLGNGKFSWTSWDSSLDISTPTGMLYALKCHCAGRRRTGAAWGKLVGEYRKAHGGEIPEHYGKVIRYYSRIVSSLITEDLIPILKDWMKDFPPDEKGNSPEKGEELGGGGGDLEEASEQSETNEGEGGPDPEGESDKKVDGSTFDRDGSPDPTGDDPTHTEGSFVGGFDIKPTDSKLVQFEKTQANRLAALLTRAFKVPGNNTCNGPTPSKKLNVRGLAKGDFRNPYRVSRQSGIAKKPHISLLVDCSGSMGAAYCGITPADVTAFNALEDSAGYPTGRYIRTLSEGYTLGKGKEFRNVMRRDGTTTEPKARVNATLADVGGRIMARALHLLAKKGSITAVVYACRRGGVSHRIELPARNDHSFSVLYADSGSEGIGDALNPAGGEGSHFKEIASRGKLVFTWTEGCITDEPINRAVLRARGLYTVGLMASLCNQGDELAEHFDASICRSSIFGVASELVKVLRAGTSSR